MTAEQTLPEAMRWSTANCTISRTMEILGEKWTFHVLREVFLGVRRFEDIRARTDIPRQVLTDRLTRLIDRGLLHRVPYRVPGQRERSEYRLTEAGLDLYPVLVALVQWGDQHLPIPGGPPLVAHHRGCEAEVQVVLRCQAGHEPTPRETAFRPGPTAQEA
ncbi:HxlR family transcriptional regulator [Kribbella amoyensis]|uniref:HxlR family transcriptional regulator n=1 Tax=Kribbella amoyensis TaxID=996641 RepID=A0A561BU90_9ACTN|nr:helix-turn-helix domain-containing protein [Kribbella amoyensis]TWD82474.1 HxlR family transcriptional regulator [Kribbella amoyensis]